jgi:hypothetical protein
MLLALILALRAGRLAAAGAVVERDARPVGNGGDLGAE